MGKKKGSSSLGKGILKDRSKSTKKVSESWLHTSELNDGYDWNRINLRSVTEQSNLDDFLETAELAGTEFTAERLNVKVIDPSQHTGLPSAEETIAITKAQKENLDFLQIPRRPKWDSTTTAEQLNQTEREAFLEWRRQLSLLQEKDHIVLTPFERNLDFWRQLWRVIERSDIVVQIVDARNPLLFRCEDLEKYVKELSESKENVILISKADLLTQAQREYWASYFSQQGIRVAFWSAVREEERLNQKEEEEGDGPMDAGDEDDEDDDEDEENEEEEGDEEEMEEGENPVDESAITGSEISGDNLSDNVEGLALSSNNRLASGPRTDECREPTSQRDSQTWDETDDSSDGARRGVEEHSHRGETAMRVESSETEIPASSRTESAPSGPQEQSHSLPTPSHAAGIIQVSPSGGQGDQCRDDDDDDATRADSPPISNASHLLTGEELLDFLKGVHAGRSRVNDEVMTVGMVGYPNVGKSSTINALLREKKVPVSATPGRTKHFQTLFVEPALCLCDCPGLVMPSFVSTKADMYLNGILPIDQMRDFTPPVSQLCQRVPREVLELTYGMNLIQPGEGEDPDRAPSALELLNAHAYVRGYMTHKGVPDCFRSARIVLKDYVKGKLLYRVPPPGMTTEEFDSIHFPTLEVGEVTAGSRPKKRANKPMMTEGGQTVKRSAAKKVDDSFFAKPSTAHTKAMPPRVGVVGQHPGGMVGVGVMGKPWKKQKRGKKEKLRRVYGHLDEK